MAKLLVGKSRSAMPGACNAAMTAAIAVLLSETAISAVCELRTTEKVRIAMSGASEASPSPETRITASRRRVFSCGGGLGAFLGKDSSGCRQQEKAGKTERGEPRKPRKPGRSC